MKQIFSFLSLFLCVVVLIFGGLWVADQVVSRAADAVTENTPSQAIQLGDYVQRVDLNPIEAQTVYTLALADATVRDSQTRHLSASAEAYAARSQADTERLEVVADKLGPKVGYLVNMVAILLVAGAVILAVQELLRRKPKGE